MSGRRVASASRPTIFIFSKRHSLSNTIYHTLKQHAERWEEYNELFVDDKKAYFDNKVKRTNTMHMYIEIN